MTETRTATHRAALEYIEHGLAVIPLEPKLKTPATKHGLNDWTDNPGDVNNWWALGYNFNVGIVCGQVSGGLVVIDLDAHGGADGRETLRDWEVTNGELPETVTSITGSGGKHLLYRASFSVRPSTNAALGVDIRGDGSYIVAPPSIHPNGERYEWSISPDDCDIATADDRVLAFIDYVRPAHADKFDAQGRYEPFALPERIGAGERNDTLFRYAAQLRSKEMGEGEILALLQLANARHCDPPMSEGELASIAQNVTTRYAPGHSAEVRAIEERRAKAVKADLVPESPVRIEKPEKGDKNATALDMFYALTDDEEVAPLLRYDVLEKKRWKMGRLPLGSDDDARPLTDMDEDCLWAYYQQLRGWNKRVDFNAALSVMFTQEGARMNRIKETMDALPRYEWADKEHSLLSVDGVEVPSTAGLLLFTWLGADMTEYNYEAERLMLREIVARALHPGCKADIMPVLYGGQGIGKSTFVEALALDDSFFLPTFSNFDEEHLRRLPGHLIVEVGELAAFRWDDMNAIKDALSRQKDVLRLPYARNTEEFPRTCVFIGTTNSHAFLTDETGNRRFMPIECKAESYIKGMRDDGRLVHDIRLAYGEILAEHDRDPETFLQSLTLPDAVAEEAERIRTSFMEENKILNDVRDYLADLPIGTRVNVQKFWREHYGLSREEWRRVTKLETKDTAAAFNACKGWKHIGKQAVSGYGTALAWERIK